MPIYYKKNLIPGFPNLAAQYVYSSSFIRKIHPKINVFENVDLKFWTKGMTDAEDSQVHAYDDINVLFII